MSSDEAYGWKMDSYLAEVVQQSNIMTSVKKRWFGGSLSKKLRKFVQRGRVYESEDGIPLKVLMEL